MKTFADTFVLTLLAGFAVFCVAWMTVFPTLGLLWCMGVLK